MNQVKKWFFGWFGELNKDTNRKTKKINKKKNREKKRKGREARMKNPGLLVIIAFVLLYVAMGAFDSYDQTENVASDIPVENITTVQTVASDIPVVEENVTTVRAVSTNQVESVTTIRTVVPEVSGGRSAVGAGLSAKALVRSNEEAEYLILLRITNERSDKNNFDVKAGFISGGNRIDCPVVPIGIFPGETIVIPLHSGEDMAGLVKNEKNHNLFVFEVFDKEGRELLSSSAPLPKIVDLGVDENINFTK
ncbi:MAG: hypothetical protein WC178_04765 [Candidatus Paceibacterota bacterium]